MSISTRAAGSIAAIALIFSAACAGDAGDTADTAAGAVGATTAATAAPDADRIDDRVEVALNADSTLRGFGLDADEDNNTVVLKGAVRTDAQKQQAAQVATGVASGVTIDNRIRVDANARMSNDMVDVDDIEEQIEKAIEDDATLRSFDLDVDEDNGQIKLEGRVQTAEQKTAIETLAKRIAGTVTVVNNIKTS
jgi:osmotically-inducible protein OsmY